MAVAISSLPSIRCSNQTWIYTSKLEIYSMAPAQLQTNIRHSRVWLWGRAKVPINSKSGSRAAVDRGGKCVFGNLTMSLSSERSTAAGSAHPLVIVTDGSGHSSTSPPPPRNPHTSQKKNWMGFLQRSRAWSCSRRAFLKSQHKPQHPRLFSKHESVWKRNMVTVGWKPCFAPNVSFSGSKKNSLLLNVQCYVALLFFFF